MSMAASSDHSLRDERLSGTYRAAFDRITAPAALKEKTILLMRQEQEKSRRPRVISFSAHVWQTAVSVAAAAVVFLLVGRYLLPAVPEAAPARGNNAATLMSTYRFPAGPGILSASGQQLSVSALDMSLAEARDGYGLTEREQIGAYEVYLPKEADDASAQAVWRAVYETPEGLMLASGTGFSRERFLLLLEAALTE